MKLKDSQPNESFFQALLDDDDEEEASLMAARQASEIMLAQAMANKGM